MALTKDEFVAKFEQERACYAFVMASDCMYFLREDVDYENSTSITDLFTSNLSEAVLFDIDDALLLRDVFAFLADIDLQIVRLSTKVDWIVD